MSSFGDRLKQERESRGASIDDIADATKIHRRFLEALERNDFETLPGTAYGKFYIRAYATVLQFDPESLIADYDRECHRLEREDLPETRPEASTAEVEEAIDEAVEKAVATPPEKEPPPEVHAEPTPSIPDEAVEAIVTETAEEAEAEAEAEEKEEPAPPEVVRVEPAPSASVPDPVRPDPVPASSSRRRATGMALIVMPALILGGWIYIAFFRTAGVPEEPAAVPEPVRSASPEAATEIPAVINEEEQEPAAQPVVMPETSKPVTTREPPPKQAAADPPPELVPARPANPSRLTVTEYGIGTGISNSRLEGRGEAIEEGDVAWFQTRVRGGRLGEQIRHVWIHEGKTIQSISLKIGSSHWRTHSRKTLGQQGQWAVEVRDAQGRVLASDTVTCVRVRR